MVCVCDHVFSPDHDEESLLRRGRLKAIPGTSLPFSRDCEVGQTVADDHHPDWYVLRGSNRVDNDPYGNRTQFDHMELPQQRVWLDTYEMNRDEASLGGYVAFLQKQKLHPCDELQKLLWHVITVHSVSDQTLTRWPALYVTWREANDLCAAKHSRLPIEVEWEKAARGSAGIPCPWGEAIPNSTLMMFGQHHVHEIPILAAVDSYGEGKIPYGLHHMTDSIAEWVEDWFGFDHDVYMLELHPTDPTTGRYESIRGGSWKSNRVIF